MTYFPAACFDLIKEFADINGARYHHREVARMIKSHLAYCKRIEWRRGCTCDNYTPIVYKILFAEERLKDMRAHTPDIGHTYQFILLHKEQEEEYDNLKFNQALAMHLIQWEKTQTRPPSERLWWEKTQTRPPSERLWLKLTTKPDPPRETDDVSLDTSPSYDMSVNELEQFCIVNQLPQEQYANLNKQELISLILKYNFD